MKKILSLIALGMCVTTAYSNADSCCKDKHKKDDSSCIAADKSCKECKKCKDCKECKECKHKKHCKRDQKDDEKMSTATSHEEMHD